jgi:hypothetical protein
MAALKRFVDSGDDNVDRIAFIFLWYLAICTYTSIRLLCLCVYVGTSREAQCVG